MKKLLNNKGESIIEVLVSLLIVALCILMLQGSIVTAAKINKKTQEDITPFVIGGSIEPGSVTTTRDGNTCTNNVNIYKTDGGYYYYEYQK